MPPSDATHLNLVQRGKNSAFYHRDWDGVKWSPWNSIGGSFLFEPLTVDWGKDELFVFGIADDSSLQYKIFSKKTKAWGEKWENLGGSWTGKPAAASMYPNSLELILPAADTALHHIWFKGNSKTWSAIDPYAQLQGVFKDTPVMTSREPERFDIFAKGLDGTIWHKFWAKGEGWSPGGKAAAWENLDGPFLDTPKAVSWGENRIDLFGIAKGGILRHKYWDGKSWSSGWEGLDGTWVGRPEVVSSAPNKLEVYVIGQDRAIYHRTFDGASNQWQPSGTQWEKLDRKVAGDQITAVSLGEGRLELFHVGLDSKIYHKSSASKAGWVPVP